MRICVCPLRTILPTRAAPFGYYGVFPGYCEAEANCERQILRGVCAWGENDIRTGAMFMATYGSHPGVVTMGYPSNLLISNTCATREAISK